MNEARAASKVLVATQCTVGCTKLVVADEATSFSVAKPQLGPIASNNCADPAETTEAALEADATLNGCVGATAD